MMPSTHKSSYILPRENFSIKIFLKILILVKNLLVILFPVALLSCSSVGKIAIQTSIPPKYPVSSEIQSIAVLNRSINLNFTNLTRDSLEKILIKNELFLDTLVMDSVAADTSIQVAAKALFESGRFDVVVPKQRNIYRNDRGELLNPLDKSFINDICKDFNVDAVLVLESFTEKLSSKLKVSKYPVGFEQGVSLGQYGYNSTIDVAYNLIWRLYQPQLNPAILRYDVRDTVYWDAFDYSINDMYKSMPSVKEALIGGGIASGIEMSEYISPKWKDEIRYYFITGKKEIDAAIPFIKQDKWEEAATLWRKYASVPSKTLRSKIEYNLALASEMTGNLELAIEWAVKSYETNYSKRAESYIRYLSERQILLKKTTKK